MKNAPSVHLLQPRRSLHIDATLKLTYLVLKLIEIFIDYENAFLNMGEPRYGMHAWMGRSEVIPRPHTKSV